MITMIVGRCPVDADEVAEAYLLGTLPRERGTAFEEHYIGCPDCVERLQFTEEFLLAVRPAAAQLRILTAPAYVGAIPVISVAIGHQSHLLDVPALGSFHRQTIVVHACSVLRSAAVRAAASSANSRKR